jgi:hypothetical protein
MKTTKLFFMAALALMTAACSNDDNDLTQQPAKAEGITFTATISLDQSATTRALTENGTTIEATWATGEKVALIHNGVKDEMTVSAVIAGVATITGTITGSPSGSDAVTIIYPSDAADGTTGNVKSDWLSTQDGTMEGTSGTSIEEKYDVRKGSGALNASCTSFDGTVSLTNQNAIFKLTLKDIDGTNDVSATSVVISDQTGVVTTVTPASGYENAMYVALPTTATTLKFLVTGSDSKKYFNMASGLSLNASYYQSTVKLATVGDVILSTGKCAKAGTGSPVAMIAYLGNGSDCTNGLAIQLNTSPVEKNWNDAKTYASGLTAVPGGTWRLPSKDDWQNMFVGCAKSGDAGAGDTMNPIAGFKEKIGATGITWQSTYYWSSSDSESYAWSVGVYLNDSNARANFVKSVTSTPSNVLGCLAF